MLVPSLALFFAVGAAGTPEMVVFPPQPEGLDQKRAIEVWSVITAQLKEDRAKLGVSFKVQQEAHDVLLGQGREQAWECGLNARCLSDIGGTLGASVVVAGTISESAVSLVVIEVADKKKVTGAKSSPKLAQQASARQALAAAKGLVAAYLKVKSKGAKSVLAGEAEGGAEAAGEAALAEKPSKPEKPAKGSKPEKPAKGGKGAATAKVEPPPPEPEAPPPDQAGSSIDGMIRIARTQLENVTSVSVDGAALVARDDGTMIWIGSPGTHTVRARRSDGATYSKDIEVEPRSTTDLVLEFSSASVTPAFAATYEEEEKPITKKWWFWTSVGGAVVAGGVLSLIFIGGSKGGPSISGELGSVSGTY